MTFESLFQQATGREPYPYQSRFAAGQTLPELLSVPTREPQGVSPRSQTVQNAAVILSWLWRRRPGLRPSCKRPPPAASSPASPCEPWSIKPPPPPKPGSACENECQNCAPPLVESRPRLLRNLNYR
jgi:hypothetical protein